jgi:hypothetical protein
MWDGFTCLTCLTSLIRYVQVLNTARAAVCRGWHALCPDGGHRTHATARMPRRALLGPYIQDRRIYTRRRIRSIQEKCGGSTRTAPRCGTVHEHMVQMRRCAEEVEKARDPYTACDVYWRLVDIADRTVDAICTTSCDVTRAELKRNQTLDILNTIAVYGDGAVSEKKIALRAALARAGVGVKRAEEAR